MAGQFVLLPYMGESSPSVATLIANGFVGNNASYTYYLGAYKSSGYPCYATIIGGEIYMFTYEGDSILAWCIAEGTSVNSYGTTGGVNVNGSYIAFAETSFGGVTNIGGISGNQFETYHLAALAFYNLTPPDNYLNINYNIQNGSVIGPAYIAPGDNVTAYVTMNAGYSLQSDSIKVQSGGSTIPFNYSNGTLTFTAPG